MILLGFGAGMAFNPVLLAAMSDVQPQESGLASGVVNTAFMMGGALGLAVLASLAASRTDSLRASGDSELAALAGGYHAAFLVGAIFAATAGGDRGALLRTRTVPAETHASASRPTSPQGAVSPAPYAAPVPLTYRERPSVGEAEGLLVLHHGRGADEVDLIGLADALDPRRAAPRRRASRAVPAARAGRATTGTSSRASATPTRRPSTPRTASSPPSTTSCGSGRGSDRSAPCSAASRWAR